MLLTVDVGNTSISLGYFENNNLSEKFSISSKLSSNCLKAELSKTINKKEIDSVIIASVVKEVTPVLEVFCQEYLKLTPIIVSHKSNLDGMQLLIDNPRELGADRICNLVATRYLINKAAIIIDLGTATTFEILDHKLNFIGGIICPGIELGFCSLNTNTSLLPSISDKIFTDLIGKNTITNITSGIFAGHASMIDGLILRLKENLDPHYKTVITGGYSSMILNLLKENIDYVLPDLTHTGLQYLFNLNKSTC